MRGRRNPQASVLAFVDLEEAVPPQHQLRMMKRFADRALLELASNALPRPGSHIRFDTSERDAKTAIPFTHVGLRVSLIHRCESNGVIQHNSRLGESNGAPLINARFRPQSFVCARRRYPHQQLLVSGSSVHAVGVRDQGAPSVAPG